jgi:CPA2 family monovalent cation:H+ antiporter-2
VLDNWLVILLAVPASWHGQEPIIYGLCRMCRLRTGFAAQALLLSQGGEFGFVLFTTAAAAGIFDPATASLLIAIVTVTMALTPLVGALPRYIWCEGESREELDEDFEGAPARRCS